MKKIPMCERCDALCCKAYDIYDTQSEKFIKRADTPCHHLEGNRCGIYHQISEHPGYRESCHQYDCLEAGPIITSFLRKIPEGIYLGGITSSLLETIRLRIMKHPEKRDKILTYAENILDNIKIDGTLLLQVKVARVKIERFL